MVHNGIVEIIVLALPSQHANVEALAGRAVEELAIRAAREASERTAVEAFALHPLVDSVTVARELLAGYRARIPTLDQVFRRT